ncbi:MAG: ATP-binding cassette domain-containing protein, partial [Clostridia bacterium]|nr:ATP-binding cassette domain-containing protein [Clostridia bacterium]
KTKGLCVNLPVNSNINQVNMNLKKGFIVYEGQFKSSDRIIVDKLRIKIKGVYQKVNNLSGGNQQKVLLSKWLAQDAEVFILDEPTRGIDVSTKVEIYELIRELARAGKAVLMISSEMQELIAICDRILVINEGRIVGEFAAAEATEQKILEKAILGKEAKNYDRRPF